MTTLSQIVVNVAIYLLNYPTILMFKSCTIISVVLVAIFCSQIKSKKLKLGLKKFITAAFVTFGILLYYFGGEGDPSKKEKEVGLYEYALGLILLTISLFADGFLPDFQA